MLRRETQSNWESMRPFLFFHLYILSSATTALSTLCQDRLNPYIYTTLLKRLVELCSLTATPKDGSSPIRLFNQEHTDTAKKQLFEKLIIPPVN